MIDVTRLVEAKIFSGERPKVYLRDKAGDYVEIDETPMAVVSLIFALAGQVIRLTERERLREGPATEG